MSGGTRPDITYTTHLLARFSESPKLAHWNAIKRIIKYIKGTMSKGIVFSESKLSLITYSDADFAADPDERKSTSGYVILMNGGPLCWKSQKQSIIAQSTTEAEFIAGSYTRDLVWIQQMLSELGRQYIGKTNLMMDSMSAIKWITNDQTHPKNKHVAIKYMLIRDLYMNQILDPIFVNTSDQIADILTKPLAKDAFNKLCSNLVK